MEIGNGLSQVRDGGLVHSSPASLTVCAARPNARPAPVEMIRADDGTIWKFDTSQAEGRAALQGLMNGLAGGTREERLAKRIAGIRYNITNAENTLRYVPAGDRARVGLLATIERNRTLLAMHDARPNRQLAAI